MLMLFDFVDSLDSLVFPASYKISDTTNNIRLYSDSEHKMFYEVLVPGVLKSDIQLYKTNAGLEVKVNYPEYPSRDYRFGQPKKGTKTYTLKIGKSYSYEKSSLENGILTIQLTKVNPPEKESQRIEW